MEEKHGHSPGMQMVLILMNGPHRQSSPFTQLTTKLNINPLFGHCFMFYSKLNSFFLNHHVQNKQSLFYLTTTDVKFDWFSLKFRHDRSSKKKKVDVRSMKILQQNLFSMKVGCTVASRRSCVRYFACARVCGLIKFTSQHK